MKIVLLRFLTFWIVLHIILYFIEKYRYEHSDLSWCGFKDNEMLGITRLILGIDMLGGLATIFMGLIYWIFQPMIF